MDINELIEAGARAAEDGCSTEHLSALQKWSAARFGMHSGVQEDGWVYIDGPVNPSAITKAVLLATLPLLKNADLDTLIAALRMMEDDNADKG